MRAHLRSLAIAAGTLLAVALQVCGPAPAAVSRPRVAVIFLENREYGDVIGNPALPYLNSLAQRYALATAYYGIRHPSLPNYIAATSGSTAGIDRNCLRCHVRKRNLVDQLESAGISWKAYLEDAPRACYRGSDVGLYAKRHNPFAYYDSVVRDRGRCRKLVPLTRLDRDLARRKLPRFVWITPNRCHDMHDCASREADDFLSRLLPPLIAQLGPRGVLFITFDEGTTTQGCCMKARGGRVATIVAGPGARRGIRSDVPYNHYSLLRTIEQRFGLPKLGQARCTCTKAMRDMVLPAR